MPTKRATTISPDSIEQFRNSLCVMGRSPKTASAYASDLSTMVTEIGDGEISEVDLGEVAANWLTGNRKRVAPKTTSRRLTSVRAFARWAGWGDVLEEYRSPSDPPSQPHPLPEGIDGVRRMIAASRQPHHAALVALCGMVGCRVGESVEIRPEHFNLPDMILRVNGKGEKVRFVPVSTEAWSALAGPVTQAFLLGNERVVPIRERVARQNITLLAERAGLSRRVSSHDLRATFATEVYNKTLNMRLVQELLGHSSVSTTQLYVGLRAEQLRAAVEL